MFETLHETVLVHAVMPVLAVMPMPVGALELTHISQALDLRWNCLGPDSADIVSTGRDQHVGNGAPENLIFFVL